MWAFVAWVWIAPKPLDAWLTIALSLVACCASLVIWQLLRRKASSSGS
jgi:hypothetical protein